ncbi:MAG TPA: LamG-like jellyroll fold domain-containing protein [Polyangia bacterium]
MVRSGLFSRRWAASSAAAFTTLVLLTLLARPAVAATTIWAGAAGGVWDVAANWVDGAVPGANDTVAFKGFVPLATTGWTGSSSTSTPGDLHAYAIDGRRSTRWSVGNDQTTDDWFKMDMATAQTISRVDVDAGDDYPTQYPRNYKLEVSTDNTNWTQVASGTGSARMVSISFTETSARYIRISITALAAGISWCISEFTVFSTAASAATRFSRASWVATGSNASDVANAIDSDLTTRWASGAPQVNGQWFKVDIGAARSITAISMDAYSSTGDYPRTFTVAVSTDDSSYTNVATGITGASEFILQTFSVQTARYVRVTQTGSSGGAWWSIHDFNVYGTPGNASIYSTTTVASLSLGKACAITQESGVAFTVSGSFAQTAGTFALIDGIFTVGGDYSLAGDFIAYGGKVFVRGDFNHSSGTFTAPASLFQVGGAFTKTGGTYSHNSGRLLLSSTDSETFATNNATFGNVYINDGLVGYWKLDEGSGASVSDMSGHGHTGTLYNTPTWAAGPTTFQFANSSAMVLNGTSQYARVSRMPALEPTSVSVSLWFKRNGAQSQYAKIVSNSYNNNGSAPYASYEIQLNNPGSDSGMIGFQTGHTGAAINTVNSTAGAAADGTWVHVLAVYEPSGSAPQKRLYVNGVLNSSGTVSTALLYDTSSAGDFYMGQAGAGGQYFKGTVDDVRVFSRALTATDAALLYNGGQRTTPSGTQTLSGTLTTTGNVVLAGGTLDVSATACSAAPCSVSVGGSWTNYGGTFTPRTGTVTLNGTGATSVIRSDRVSFYNLTVSNTGTWTFQDRLYVSNLLTMSAGNIANAGYPMHAATVTKTAGSLTGAAALVLDAASSKSLTLNSTATPVRVESPLDNGLVGYWKFDEGRGSTTYDLSGNGNNGTVVGGAPFTADVPASMPIDDAGALVFDGTSQYVDLGAPAGLNVSGQITMAAWVKINATDGFRNILSHGASDSPERDTFLRIYGGEYRVGTWYSPTDTYASYAMPGGDVGTWVHLVGVNDGTTWRLYRNGVQVATQAGSAGAYTATANWRIGAQGSSASRFFSGSIDDVRIYNRGLTANEVAALYTYGYTTGSSATYSLAANATMTSTLKLDSGSLNAVSYSNAITGATTVNGGTYTIGSHTSGQTFTGGLGVNRYGVVTLASTGGKAILGSASTFAMDGTLNASNTGAAIQSASGTYNFRVGSVSGATPTLNITGLQVKNTTADGMFINYNTGASTTFTRFDNIAFSSGAGTGAGNYNLQIYATALYLTSSGCSFDSGTTATVANNVKLTGNGVTAASETRVIFGGATCASNKASCEAYDDDDDAAADGVGDTTASNGAVVQWVKTAATDTAGTIEGFPTAAFDWNNFTYYATYVAYHDTSGTADTVYARTSTGAASYGWSTSSGEDIIGTPRWDTASSVHYVYVATTGGKVYRLIDNGSTLTADTVSPWNGANNPYDCSCTITTPLAQDNGYLYWGGSAAGTHKLWTLSKTSTTRLPAGSPLATSTTTNNAAPALWTSGSTYAYLGLAGRVSKINVTTQANVADNTNPASSNPVMGRITVVADKLYATDDNGYLWCLDPGTNFGANAGTYKFWSYRDANHSGGCGGVCQIRNHYFDPTATNVYYGDQDGHIDVVNASGNAVTGFPYRPGTSSDAFAMAPFHRSGVILAGTTTGTLYVIDQSTNGTTPGVIQTYQFGSANRVSGVGYNPNVNAYMVSTANDTSKDGKLYYLDLVSDPTPSYP